MSRVSGSGRFASHGFHVAVLVIIVSIGPREAAARKGESDYSWWQTSCNEYGVSPSRVVGVKFRRFPVADDSIDDEKDLRSLQFDERGIAVRIGENRYEVRAQDIVAVVVIPLGKKGSALTIELRSKSGIVADGIFGVVELTCWRNIEALVNGYGPGKIQGSPVKTYIPLRDANGNVIPESVN
jgi:hypothetical protein